MIRQAERVEAASDFDALIDRGEVLFRSMPIELRDGLWQSMQRVLSAAGSRSCDRCYARRWIAVLDALDGLSEVSAHDALSALGPAAAWLLKGF